MPRKIRALLNDLQKSGFINRGGKGSEAKDSRSKTMKGSAKYLKIVEWSDEDQCFIGECPGVIGPCCHGENEREVYSELCEIVDEWLDLWKKEGKPLPPSTYGRGIAQKLAEMA